VVAVSLSPQQTGQDRGGHFGKPRQVPLILLSDILANLGLPAPAGLELPQRYQVIREIEIFFRGGALIQLFWPPLSD
jgi:hypothetical protein